MEDVGSSMKKDEIKYPNMRYELRSHLKSLADVQEQELWKDCNDFDEAIHFIFDDTKLSESPQELIGIILLSEQEVVVIKRVVESIERVLAFCGDNAAITDYKNSTEWKNLVEYSKVALNVMGEN